MLTTQPTKGFETSYRIDIQNAYTKRVGISPKILKQWAAKTLAKYIKTAEITIRLVDIDEIKTLNHTYRHKNQPTNVLSFPSETPHFMADTCHFIGDVVIAPQIVKQESLIEKKLYRAHFAHMLIHGILHLLGYDHLVEKEALKMQREETELLESFGFENPWVHE